MCKHTPVQGAVRHLNSLQPGVAVVLTTHGDLWQPALSCLWGLLSAATQAHHLRARRLKALRSSSLVASSCKAM